MRGGTLKWKEISYLLPNAFQRAIPDKVSDAISDAILDECLRQDPNSRVAVETLVTTGQVVLAGELTTKAYVDFQDVARSVVNRIGYNKGEYLFFGDGVAVLNSVHSQSPDISQGVDVGGAGDQGMMFGGAVNETPELMPLPIAISRALINRYTEYFQERVSASKNITDDVVQVHLPWSRPDAKSQVTVLYRDGKPHSIDTVVMSCQHDDSYSQEEISASLKKFVIYPVLEEYGFKEVNNLIINPTGRFVIGGPHGDTGLTGRKIIVDTYGGYFSHGGGAFSGKDPSKVDRSGAYASRWVAKNIVGAGLADKCEVQVSYAIGVVDPVSVLVRTFGTSKVPEELIEEAVKSVFDLTPNGIIRDLELKEPKFLYSDLASHGHFGRDNTNSDVDLPWERLSKVEQLKQFIENK